jgi:putative peptidoglycan lipid II flippase
MNLIKSTGTFSFFTIISRILGYLRDILIAIFLGTSFLADAFFVAFRIPNTFRRLFSEGTFNAAFVPSYSSEILKGKAKSNKFASEVFNLLFLILLILILLVQIFMPAFVSLIAPGFLEDDKKNAVSNKSYKDNLSIFIVNFSSIIFCWNIKFI